jgi:hypothetical protein
MEIALTFFTACIYHTTQTRVATDTKLLSLATKKVTSVASIRFVFVIV